MLPLSGRADQSVDNKNSGLIVLFKSCVSIYTDEFFKIWC